MNDLPDIAPFCAEKSLGQGGVGHVYLASSNGTQLAIKVVHPEIATADNIVESLLSNARSLRAIHHPNLVTIHDAGRLDDGRPFISMEYLEGEDLAQVLARERALAFPRVVQLGRALCSGLAALHEADLWHLDLKPTNVLLSGDDEQIKLLDLGLAATGGPGFSNLDLGPGSPEYWSPEHARGAVDERSDIYALGVVMYEALTGAAPFSSHSVAEVIAQHLHAEPSRLSPPPTLPPIPEALQEIVLRCLRKDPSQRFQTVSELRTALDDLDRQLLAPRTVDGSTTWHTGPRRRSTWLLAAAAAVAFLVAAGLWFVREHDVRPRAPTPPAEVAVMVTSAPEGAYIYRRGGGALLGRTPATVRVPRSATPLDLVLRFPSGKKTHLRVTPDQAVQVHGVEPEEAP